MEELGSPILQSLSLQMLYGLLGQIAFVKELEELMEDRSVGAS